MLTAFRRSFAEQSLGTVRGVIVPHAWRVIQQDGTLLPDNEEIEIPEFAARRSFWVQAGPMDGAAESLSPGLRCIYKDVCSAYETRTLVLFENDELLVASEDGHAFVRRVAKSGAIAFREPDFTETDFWMKVNPRLDKPFVEPLHAQFSALRFRDIRSTIKSRKDIEQTFWTLCELIVDVTHSTDSGVEIELKCGSRDSPPSVRLIRTRYPPYSIVNKSSSITDELLRRTVEHFQPFSEGFRSPRGAVGAWCPEKDAQWTPAILKFQVDSAIRSPLENTVALGNLRNALREAGVNCDELFKDVWAP